MAATRVTLPRRSVLPLSLARVMFVVLVVGCNVEPRTIPVWFTADWVPGLIYLLLSFTNGILVSMTSSMAPDSTEEVMVKGEISNLVAFVSSVGLFTGSVAVFPLLKLVNI